MGYDTVGNQLVELSCKYFIMISWPWRLNSSYSVVFLQGGMFYCAVTIATCILHMSQALSLVWSKVGNSPLNVAIFKKAFRA